MPLLGWIAGTNVDWLIRGVDHWVALALLSFVGVTVYRVVFEEAQQRATLKAMGYRNRYFVGNAQLLRRLMTVERALQDNSKVVVPEDFDTTVKAPEPPQLPAGHPSVPSDKQ